MKRLIQLLSSLRRDRDGVAGIEFAIVAPLLILLMMGSVATFDLYRTAQSIEKATFTVGDVLSRQSTVSASFLQSAFDTMNALVPGGASQVSMRVTSIKRTNGVYVVEWSKVLGKSVPIITNSTIPNATIPDIANGDSVLVTDTFVPYSSAFSVVGFTAITFTNTSIYRPRFTSSIAYMN